MKRKFSKKILSAFLAVVMVVTSIPMFAATALAADSSSTKYLMAYFTGNGNVTSSGKQQAIRFAVSEDGENYTALNGNAPAILQTTGSHNARDPYIFRGQDGYYYLIATDADYSNGGWGNAQSTMTVWQSGDLTHWSNETHVDISTISGWTFTNYCWAPQAIWDSNAGKYMIYFATSDGSKQTIHYIYTSDLLDVSKYEAPKQLVEFNYNGTGYASIDADITEYNGKYIMFFKDESNYDATTNPGGKKLAFSVADKLVENTITKAVILNESAHNVALEGPQFNAMADGTYSLLADYFGDSGNFYKYNMTQDQLDAFIAAYDSANNGDTLELSSLMTFDTIINNIQPRHGSVIQISAPEYQELVSSFADAVPAGHAVNDFSADSSALVARYMVNDATTDVQGGTSLTNNNVTWTDNQYNSLGVASFTTGKPGSYLYANTGLLAKLDASNGVTFSFLAKSDKDNISAVGQLGGRFFEFNNKGASNSAAWASTGNSCISVSNSGITEVMNDNYGGKAQVNPSVLRADAWHHYTVSINSTSVSLYIDGVKIGEGTRTDTTTGTDNLQTVFNNCTHFIIGGSFYQDDNTYEGQMRDLRIYNKAITDDQAANLPMQYELDTYESSASAGTQVYGNVTIDPIVYVHGEFTGTIKGNDNQDEYDYMMNGSTIADGSYDGECSTAVSVGGGKTLSSVVATDSGATLSVANGKLTGDLAGGYGSVTSYDSDSTVTLKFTFTDGTYEIHKLPVKPNPVATHTVSGGFNYSTALVTTYRYGLAYLTIAKGSYGQLGSTGGSFGWEEKNKKGYKEEYANYAKMYSAYDSTFDWYESDALVLVDSMTENKLAVDKIAGYLATGGWQKNGARYITVNSPTATYYIDLSSNNNYGVSLNGTTYSIDLDTTGMYYGNSSNKISTFESKSSSSSASVTSGNSTVNNITTPSPSKIAFNSETKGTNTLTGTAAVGTTAITFNESYVSDTQNSTKVTANLNTNINLVVSDKSAYRTAYANAIADAQALTQTDYKKDSWDAYMAEILKLEEFINDNTDTDTSTSADAYTSAINTAKNNLQKKDLESINAVKDFMNADNGNVTYTDGVPTLTAAVGGNYTPDSIAKVNTILAIANKIATDEQSDDSIYATVLAELNKIGSNPEAYLMPLADQTQLKADIETLTTRSIFDENNDQSIPLSEWFNGYKAATATAVTKVVNDTKTAPRYNATAEQVSINNVTYTLIKPDTSSDSYEQGTINDTDASLQPYLNPTKLTDEDVAKFDSFNAAYEVFRSFDVNKLTDDGLALYNAIKAQFIDGTSQDLVAARDSSLKDVYVFPSQINLSIYNALTGSSYTEPTDLAWCDGATVENITTAMLTFLSLQGSDNQYINKYNAYLTTSTDNGTQTAYTQVGTNVEYGDQVSFATGAADDSTVTYYVALYNKGDAAKAVDGASVEPISVSRVSSFTGETLTKIANSDMVVTAYIKTNAVPSSSYAVKIYNGYGNVQQVEYVTDASAVSSSGATLTVDGKTVTINSYPFYTLTGWNISTNEASKTIVARPVYTASTTSVELVIAGGGGTATGDNYADGKAVRNKVVTLTAKEDNNFYAWARLNKLTGRYEIISYDKVTKVIPVADAEYHVITKAGDWYDVDNNGDRLTDTDVAGFDSIGDNLTLDDALDAKIPFTYIDVNTNVKNSTTGATGKRYYVTVTQGATPAVKSFGLATVDYDTDSTTYFAASNIGSTNQYSQVLADSVIGSSTVGAFITYTVTINGKSIDIRTVSEYNA